MEPKNWWFGVDAFPFPFGGICRFHVHFPPVIVTTKASHRGVLHRPTDRLWWWMCSIHGRTPCGREEQRSVFFVLLFFFQGRCDVLESGDASFFLIALDAGYIYYCRWYIWMMLRLDVVGRRFIVASLPEFVVSNFRPCDRLWSLSGNPTWCRFACQRPQGRFCVSSSREKAMSRDGLVGRTTTQEFKTENWW